MKQSEKNKIVKEKFNETLASLKITAELFETLIDQVNELNLIILGQKNSTYEKVLFDLDEALIKEIKKDRNQRTQKQNEGGIEWQN